MSKTINTLDLTVIIPVHSVADERFDDLLHSALMSIQNNKIRPYKVILVRCGCGDVKEVLNALDLTKYNLNIEILENLTGKAFQTQINYAASQVTTEYFSEVVQECSGIYRRLSRG